MKLTGAFMVQDAYKTEVKEAFESGNKDKIQSYITMGVIIPLEVEEL